MKRKYIGVIGLVVVLGVAIGVISLSNMKQSENESNTDATEPVEIGIVLPLTGEAATYGEAAKRGAELAMEKMNAENKIKVALMYEDSQMDPKKAVSAIQKLSTIDKVQYTIGFSSGEALAMCPVAEANKTILMVLGSSPDITMCGEYTFRDIPSDSYQAKEMANILTEKGYKKVAVIYINNEYGKGLAEEFKKDFTGEIVAFEAVASGETNLRTLLTKVKSTNPDALFVVSQAPDSYNLLKQRFEIGLTQPLFGSEAFKDDNVVKNIPVEAMKEVYALSLAPYKGAEFASYNSAHMTKYNQAPGAFAEFMYDNVVILSESLQECDAKNTECVKNAIYKTNLVGATGAIRFDQNGDVIDKAYQLYKIENGLFVEAK
jgi:branched-chain amino acid transport system substrate-binding protein